MNLPKLLNAEKKKGLKVVPVFYHVDPSDVRNQTGPFGEAFAEHNKDDRIDGEKIQKWKDALREVGNLSGKHLILHQRYTWWFFLVVFITLLQLHTV